jgi:H+/Cl- antiporter ClcA
MAPLKTILHDFRARLIISSMIPFVVIGTVILLIPAFFWWLLTGGSLLNKFIDWCDDHTPDLP